MRVRVLDVVFDVDERAQGPAVFFLGVRKSGSTMFNRLGFMLARMNGRNFVNVAGTFFQHNIDVPQWSADKNTVDLLRPGNVYGGFRTFPDPFAGSDIYAGGKKVFLYRDPRDALVSEYFSNAYSHSLPQPGSNDDGGARALLVEQRWRARNTEIGDYILQRATAMANTMAAFRPLLDDPTAVCFKYEEIIYDKGRLVADIVDHLGWKCAPGQLARILEKTDVRPAVEDPKAFVRRVTPGDHREKLDESTIAELNRVLEPVLKEFGYARQPTLPAASVFP
jgi:Sulfotransferase domain